MRLTKDLGTLFIGAALVALASPVSAQTYTPRYGGGFD